MPQAARSRNCGRDTDGYGEPEDKDRRGAESQLWVVFAGERRNFAP
jgi:hypothetical protein